MCCFAAGDGVANSSLASAGSIYCNASILSAGVFASAIALLAVGVPRETVMADFLLSNDFLAERIEAGVARIQANTTADLDPDVLAQVIGVSAASLEGAFAEMEAQYGSVKGYIRDRLGVDETTRIRLQRVLLE